MRKILLFLMIISLVKIAQVNGQTFNNYYGSGTFSMNGNVGIPTEDGGYIVGGTSNPVTADWTKTDGMLMKLDALGNLVWSKRYNLNNYLDEFRKIIPITNHSSGVAGKGYLVIGTSYYDFPNDPRTTDIIVMKVDLSGNLVWTRSFTRSGETLWNGWDNGVDAFELADGSFAIGANFLGDLGCMRLNENGNFLNGTETNSTKIVNAAGPPPMSFGGSSSEGSNDAILNSSGRMVMIGKAELRNDTTGFYLLTWDIGGIGVTPSVTMGKMFDLSLGMKDFQAICEIPGGDYIISGFTETNALGGAGDRDGILMRITPAGNVIWAKKLGSNNREEFKSVSYDNVNNIVAVTGYTEQFGGVKKGVNLTLSLTGNIISKTSLNISSEQRDIQPIPSNQYLVTGTNNARAHVYTTSSSSLLTSCGSLDPIFNIQDLTITITDIDSRFSSPFTVSPTVNDYTGASAITPVDLTPSVVSTINIPTITIQPVAPAAICAGSGNVSFSVTAVGSSLTYQWRENGVNITNGGAYSGTTSTTLTITSPGSTFNGRTYDVVVTGVCGNSTSNSVTLTINPIPTVTITNPAAVCSPNTVDLTAASVTTGSTSGLTYTYFTDAAETNQITSAAASAIATSGTYYIKGTTTAGCSATQPVTVTINPTPTVVITNPPAVCSPNTVNITASSVTTGSTSGLIFTYFTDAAATNQITSTAASAIATSGTYYIKGSTTDGCSVTQPVTATINPLPNFTVSKNDATTCGGTGSVTITINSPSGNYDVDLNGDGTFEYTNLAPTANTIQINNLAVGTVINDVQIRSLSTTCQNAFTINTSINAPGAPSNNTLSDAMCADGITARTLNGTPTGGVWTLATESTPGVGSISGTTFAVGSTAGTAIIRYTYAGCSSDISIVVNPIPSSPTVSNNGPICEGGNLNLAASNSTGTFNWTGPNGYTNTTQNPTINNATTAHSGTYSVTVSSNGCTSPAAVTQVTVNAIPSAPAVTISGPVCIGGNLSLTASGSETSYNWTGPNGFSSTEQNPVIPNINSTYEGTYNVTATSNGCNSSLGSANVTVNLPPAITNQPTSLPTICSGFSDLDFSVGATGTNLSYRWRENGSNILNGNSYQGATSPNLKIVRPSHTINGYAYVVVVSNLCGTITSNPVTVSIDAQSIGGSVSGEDKICEGSTSGLTLNGHNGALIMWEIAASPYTTWTQLANTSNSYTSEPLFTNTRFRAIVKNGVCPIANSAYKEVAVSKPENKAEAGNDQDICGANTASLAGNTPVAGIGTWTIIAGNGGSIESTQNPTSSFSGIIGEAYTLRWTLPNTTCPGSVDDVIIRFNQNLVAVVGSDMLNLCTTSVDLNASTPTYGNGRWEIIEGNGGAIQNPSTAASTFNGSAGNNYLLRWTVSSPNGCPSDAKDIRVSFDASPFANAGPDQTIKYGSTTHLQASGGVTYSWSSHSSISNTNIATPTVKPSSTTTYTVSVTNQHGCVGEDHVTILVEFPISIPNTFTPNGDGTNDHWEIANLETYPSAIITIYNRWGQLVATVDGGQFWDGKIKNQDAEIGTYFYILDLKNGTSPLNGSVSIVK